MEASEREEARKDYKAAMTGFGIAIVWLAIVTAISYYIAVM